MASCPEALIVGAGPAGCIAALVLARAGVRVRLVDREQFPRDKLCGDTLNPGTMALVERLVPDVAAQVRTRAVPITGMVVTGPNRTIVEASYPNGLTGVALRRRDLDAMLVEAAAAAGVEVETGVHVRSAILDGNRVAGIRAGAREPGVAMPARIVIAADGRRSKLAFGLGLSRFGAPRRWSFGACCAGVEGLGSRGEMHVRDNGYIGVAPLPGGLANVCVVRERERVRPKADATEVRLKANTTYLASGFSRTDVVSGFSRTQSASDFNRAVVADAITAEPLLRERFAHAMLVSPVLALGPLAVESSPHGYHGLLLAGDAAGFVDPMTGDGMRFAIRGGELAGLAALRELDTGREAWPWLHAKRHRDFSRKWRINRALRALVDSPIGVAGAARLSAFWPAPVRALVGIAGDVDLVRTA